MLYPDIPLKAISIQQPWAWLIVNADKNIENRSWRTTYRGPVAIHAGKTLDKDAAEELDCGIHPVTGHHLTLSHPACFFNEKKWGPHMGGIVGIAEVADCVTHSDSEWFVGEFGFVLRNRRPVPFIPCRGMLGFFDWRKNVVEA